MLAFGDKFFRVVQSENNVASSNDAVVFRPNEWRGISGSDDQNLNITAFSAKINGCGTILQRDLQRFHSHPSIAPSFQASVIALGTQKELYHRSTSLQTGEYVFGEQNTPLLNDNVACL